jgi:hypothetical protein
VPLPAARSNPSLEENQGFRAFQLSAQEAPTSEAKLANPAAEGGNMGEKWLRNFAESATSTSLWGSFTCRKARHGTDGFTSPPKEGVLRIFFRSKNPTASAVFEPANLGTKGQHATSRPPKPLMLHTSNLYSFYYDCFRCVILNGILEYFIRIRDCSKWICCCLFLKY